MVSIPLQWFYFILYFYIILSYSLRFKKRKNKKKWDRNSPSVTKGFHALNAANQHNIAINFLILHNRLYFHLAVCFWDLTMPIPPDYLEYFILTFD